ncbi:MAG: hypothetical protein ISR96_06425 [Nitrospira sp.]|nr:hypothetical protein [Nitrospira sp.]
MSIYLMSCSLPVTLHHDLADTGVGQLSAEKCRACHEVIFDEWKGSAHNRAFTSPNFRALSNEYRLNQCIPCHSPDSVFSDKLTARKVNIEEGVNCHACHALEGALQGPVEKRLPFQIHPIVEKNEAYRKSEMCGKCHISTFQEYKDSGKVDATCQDCHMPQVQRTIIDNKPWIWLKRSYQFKRHVFGVEKSSASDNWLGMTVRVSDENDLSGDIILSSKSVPHSIPSGDYGYNEILLDISLLDELDNIMQKISYSLTSEMKTALAYGETRKFPYEFVARNNMREKIRAQLVKTDYERKDIQILITRTVITGQIP